MIKNKNETNMNSQQNPGSFDLKIRRVDFSIELCCYILNRLYGAWFFYNCKLYYIGEKNFNSPKLDIFEFIFLINLMLFGSQRRLEWCIEVGVLLKRSWSFFDFSSWNGKSKGHFPDDMVGRIEFWLSSS